MNVFPARDKSMVQRCLDVRRACFVREKGIPESIERDGHDFSLSYTHFIAVSDGRDAGALRCLRVSDEEVILQRFCVIKGYRNSGVGRAMLSYVENYYSSRGVKRILLDSKFEVSAFYEKCGYKKVSDVFVEAGVEHVKMLKTLEA